MSYDICLVHEVEDIEVGNQTYNVSPMFVKALGVGLRDFNKERAGDVAPRLLIGISKMTAEPEEYKKMNPDNGWGTYEGALDYLVKFYSACVEYPDSFVSVS